MDELSIKRKLLLEMMKSKRLDAVYLCRLSNFAWYTGGLEPVIMLSSEQAEGALLITSEKSYVICNTIEYPRLRDEDKLSDKGFEFYVTPWYQGTPDLAKLVKGMRWASDWHLGNGELEIARDIARLRFQLVPEEVDRYRWLGLHAAKALEKAARSVSPGMTEMEISGIISAEARKYGITPVLILVGVDERIFHFRHPIPTLKSLEKYAMLVICAKRWGLIASATRFTHFGPLSPDLKRKETACAYVDAIYNSSTTVGARVSGIFNRAAQSYAEMGFPGEWQKHNQGGSAGYESRDYEGNPTCSEIVLSEQAFAWNPSITGIKSEDTMIVHKDGCEFLTVTDNWPTVRVEVDGMVWNRPMILVV